MTAALRANVFTAQDVRPLRAWGGATLHILPGEGHFANVQVPEKVNPLLASGLGIPADLVPKR